MSAGCLSQHYSPQSQPKSTSIGRIFKRHLSKYNFFFKKRSPVFKKPSVDNFDQSTTPIITPTLPLPLSKIHKNEMLHSHLFTTLLLKMYGLTTQDFVLPLVNCEVVTKSNFEEEIQLNHLNIRSLGELLITVTARLPHAYYERCTILQNIKRYHREFLVVDFDLKDESPPAVFTALDLIDFRNTHVFIFSVPDRFHDLCRDIYRFMSDAFNYSDEDLKLEEEIIAQYTTHVHHKFQKIMERKRKLNC